MYPTIPQKTIYFVLFFFTTLIYSSDPLEQFYQTSFLKNHTTVRNTLKKYGFREVTFKTDDGLKLSGLLLTRPNATSNIIACAGWLPGKKEGMATFYALLPQDCNILLFDARGHGESEGSLLWGLWRYGIAEYKDIVSAIFCMNKQNQLPIVIVGICSGAFNAAHALIYLEKHNKIESCRVKGLVFDSGWGSVVKIAATAPIAGIKKRLAALLSFMYVTKKNASNRLLYKMSASLMHKIYKIAHYICAKPLVTQQDRTTNLYDKIHCITTPILFIHSYDDTYAEIDDAIDLATLAQNKECWWIAQSYHAKHHLKYRSLYKEKIAAFINAAIIK